MRSLPGPLDPLDVGITRWMARHGVVVLRVGLGAVFLWFGVLKFFPDLSPAQELASKTVQLLTLGMVPGGVGLALVAVLECVIGIGLISGRFVRLTLALLAFQMVGAASPLLLFPAETFTQFPFAPTLEGQYIIKNIVFVSAGLVIGATVRGGGLSADAAKPGVAPLANSKRPGQTQPGG